MRLYQEYRINPFASCLPLLLQMPIFILLYYCIRNYPPLQNAAFLWFTLGNPDPYYVLLVIYVVSQLVSTELMLTPETPAQQKWMMRSMPVIFVAFLFRFPSGLFVYWITTNLWTVGQMAFIRYWRTHHPVELVPVAASNRKPSRFMQAMQQAQQDRTGGAQQQGKAAARKGGAPGAGKKGARPGGRPGARPQGKPIGRPAAPGAGKPAGQQGRPGEQPQARPGGGQAAPGGGQGRPGGQPQGKPGARPGGKPGGRPPGKPGGPPGQGGGRPGGAAPRPGGSPGGTRS